MGGSYPVYVPGNNFHIFQYILIFMLENADSLESALEQLCGAGIRVKKRQSVSGGDINRAFLITLSSGDKFFLKENHGDLLPMFSSESEGLLALGSVGGGAPPVPRPLAWGRDGENSFLLMDVVNPGKLDSGEKFGASLAMLHRTGRSEFCGFQVENRIGSTLQNNKQMQSWHDFFGEQRLGFQWKLAREKGYGNSSDDRAMASLLRRLMDILPEPEEGHPSLLHGDLWGGNWMAGDDGRGWLIDPAVYFGHREADIAMTELFGGFPRGFRTGYENIWPLEPGFSERRDLYNLYHLLNHLNLFGSSYLDGVISTIYRYS